MSGYLIFLHGKGADKTAHHGFMVKLAERYQAGLVSFNAPLRHKNGYKWFDKQIKDGEHIVDAEDLGRAADYVVNKVKELGLEENDIIFCGHSQGSAVAVAAAMKIPVRGVISICGDWPLTVSLSRMKNPFRILWLEGGKDTYLSQKRKDSYLYLKEKGCDINYVCDEKTEHDIFSSQLAEKAFCENFLKIRT